MFVNYVKWLKVDPHPTAYTQLTADSVHKLENTLAWQETELRARSRIIGSSQLGGAYRPPARALLPNRSTWPWAKLRIHHVACPTDWDLYILMYTCITTYMNCIHYCSASAVVTTYTNWDLRILYMARQLTELRDSLQTPAVFLSHALLDCTYI